MSVQLDDHQLRAAFSRHLDSQPLLPQWRLEVVYDGVPAHVVITDQPDDARMADVPGLTPREREVLDLLAQGRRNADVARVLHVTYRRRRWEGP